MFFYTGSSEVTAIREPSRRQDEDIRCEAKRLKIYVSSFTTGFRFAVINNRCCVDRYKAFYFVVFFADKGFLSSTVSKFVNIVFRLTLPVTCTWKEKEIIAYFVRYFCSRVEKFRAG